MAGVSSEQGGDSLNVELNLVPFIDLLSTLTLFLLVTAVWLQVSAIQAAVDSKGKSAAVQPDSEKLTIHVSAAGYQIHWPRGLSGPTSMGKNPDLLAQTVRHALTSHKAPLTAVSGDDDVGYDSVIQALDAVKVAGVPSVALSTE